jgi:hypothetical protein
VIEVVAQLRGAAPEETDGEAGHTTGDAFSHEGTDDRPDDSPDQIHALAPLTTSDVLV